MGKIYFIRHGRTEANEKWLYCGSTDLPLSASGAKELEKIRYDVPADCIFMTSGMRRTQQTLEILFGKVPHKIDGRFKEVDFGIFEMHRYEELKNDPVYQEWISGDNEKNVPPGGESGVQMQKRVFSGLHDLQKETKDVVLVTHGGVIAAIMARLFPEEQRNRYEWQPKPGCGYVVANGKYQELKNNYLNYLR